MDEEFEKIAREGFMAENGGFYMRKLTDKEYEFKTVIEERHLNPGKITHGGFIMTLLDSGVGTAVYRILGETRRIATISLNTSFVAPSYLGETIVGRAKLVKKTRSMVFMRGELYVDNRVIATADGIWKILTSSP